MGNGRPRSALLLVLLGLVHLSNAQLSSVVSTNYGLIQGSRKDFRGQTYEEFLGIPFALPPEGELRWQKPERPLSWSGIRETRQFSRKCSQADDTSSEDCLYLNVYVPGTVEEQRGNKLPVMVWIHGGGFTSGGGSRSIGYEMALKGNIIYVNINYRLNVHGFLSTGDDNAEGNYGLWDMIAALKWVKENVENFGGDPELVSIFGQSAGGAGVSHMTISPEAKGLFKRAIMSSGSAAAIFGITSTALASRLARSTGIAMGCVFLNNRMLVNCLSEKNDIDLVYYGLAAPVVLNQIIPNWLPVVDGQCVPVHPRTSLETGVNSDLDIMVGYMNDDGGAYILPKLANIQINLAFSPALMDFALKFVLNIFENPVELTELIYSYYTDLLSPDLNTRTRAAVQAVTDYAFGAQAWFEAINHYRNSRATGKKTYYREFHYVPSWERPGRVSWLGAIHADDEKLQFGEDYLGNRPLTDDDKYVMENAIIYYTNFAHTGNPNEGPNKPDIEWPEFTEDTQEMLIHDAELRSEKIPEEQQNRYKFWTEEFWAASRPSKSLGSLYTKEMADLIGRLQSYGNVEDEEIIASIIAEFILDLAKESEISVEGF